MLLKLKIEKFTISGDFSLWKMKTRALLVHQGLNSALEKDLDRVRSFNLDEKKRKSMSRVHSTIIFREITTLGIWNKVEALCMKKSLVHRLFIKKRLYTFSMIKGISMQKHIDIFNIVILNLEGVENTKFGDKDKAFLLLSSLPKSF